MRCVRAKVHRADRAVVFITVLLTLILSGCDAAGDTKTTVEIMPEEVEEYVDAASELTGDWYGWWKIYNTDGEWAGMTGDWWDCCAAAIAEDGRFELVIWDEKFSRDYYLARLCFELKDGEYRAVDAEMLDREPDPETLGLIFGHDGEPVKLTIFGSYDAVRDGGFDYCMYLRPWGSLWDDEEPPYYYESWYLPLLESGADMPDRIG